MVATDAPRGTPDRAWFAPFETQSALEGVLAGLRRRGVRAFRQASAEGPRRVEVFLRRTGAPTPVVTWPRAGGGESTPQADAWRNEAERATRMACVLAGGGFPEEAPPLLAKALRYAVAARLRTAGEAAANPATANTEQTRGILKQSGLSVETERVLAALRPGSATPNPADAAELARSTIRLVAALAVDHVPEPAVVRAALTA